MNFIKDKLLKSVEPNKVPIESKLLRFYLICELGWAFTNFIGCIAVRMPVQTMRVYLSFFMCLLLYLCFGRLIGKEKLFGEIYFYIILVTKPIIWYYSGGPRSSANILFVSELVLFVMCLSGTKMIIFIILSLLSTSVTQNVSRFLPDPVFIMEERQYVVGGAILGLTTSLLIAFLLIEQKKEYRKERDAAIASEKDLERSNSLQKNFLANMSHEIRSPLGIVMGFNNLIKDSNDIDQIHEYSKDITKAGSTLLTVINDILDYSKIESGKLDIIESDYSFSELIDDINRDIAFKCREKGLRYDFSVDKSIPSRLFGDYIRIKQCLINVLSNAVKYTEKGNVDFAVECIGVEGDNYKIRFIVRDTGKGISQEGLEKLFTAFQRLDEGMNRGIEGTGLGMAITKNLLDEMNGTISVYSTLGEGSTFVIELSQKKGSDVAETIKIDETDNLEGIKVLVVDDTKMNLTLVRKLLDKEGVIVTTIDNGKDCLEDIEVNLYDVILLDHMMPDMNGVEVFEKIKDHENINSKTPIVMLTANAMAGAMQEYLEMGFDGYLSKPISVKDLREIVCRLGKIGNSKQ